MRGLHLDGGAVVFRDDLAAPVAGPDEAIVRILRAGVCNTDLELARGYMGFRGVPGHEFVGVVETSPDAAWVGARVVGEINAGCGTCADCLAGDSRHCAGRTVLGIVGRNGTFAERIALPLRNLRRVPDGLSTALAAFTEPLAAAFAITEQLHVRPVDHVTVLGDGKLGLLVAQVLAGTGCALELVGKHADKLDIVARRGVATAHLDAWTERIRGGGRKAQRDVVVDATGSAAGFELARAAVRPRGTVVLKTTCADKLHLDTAPIVVDEIRVIGSRCGPFQPALRALAAGIVDVAPLQDRVFPFEEAAQALAYAARGGVLKTSIEIAAE